MNEIPEIEKAINEIVDEFSDEYPDYVFSKRAIHPSDLAIGYMKIRLIDKFGGIVEFWTAMVEAAKVWFDPADNSEELSRLNAVLMISAAMADQAGFWDEFSGLYNDFNSWYKNEEVEGD